MTFSMRLAHDLMHDPRYMNKIFKIKGEFVKRDDNIYIGSRNETVTFEDMEELFSKIVSIHGYDAIPIGYTIKLGRNMNRIYISWD
jgi:hypothetical protein